MFKKVISFALAVVLLITCVPVNAAATETKSPDPASVPHGFEGKTVSVLGDSISTYQGVSNNASYNSTIGSNAVYYSAGTLGIHRADTWWQ